jgi:hypothetical protein
MASLLGRMRDLKVLWIGLLGGADALSAADPLVGLFLVEKIGVSPNYSGSHSADLSTTPRT